MSKVLNATCDQNSKVTAEGFEIESVEILSEGKQNSAGALIIDGEKKYYIAKTSPDLKTTLEKLTLALGEISSALTSIGAGMTGSTTAPPPTLPATVSTINALKADLETLKGALK